MGPWVTENDVDENANINENSDNINNAVESI